MSVCLSVLDETDARLVGLPPIDQWSKEFAHLPTNIRRQLDTDALYNT